LSAVAEHARREGALLDLEKHNWPWSIALVPVLKVDLFELANSFHGFYEACPVLKSEEPARSSRLALCELTGRVLQKGLELLGIKAPEKM